MRGEVGHVGSGPGAGKKHRALWCSEHAGLVNHSPRWHYAQSPVVGEKDRSTVHKRISDEVGGRGVEEREDVATDYRWFSWCGVKQVSAEMYCVLCPVARVFSWRDLHHDVETEAGRGEGVGGGVYNEITAQGLGQHCFVSGRHRSDGAQVHCYVRVFGKNKLRCLTLVTEQEFVPALPASEYPTLFSVFPTTRLVNTCLVYAMLCLARRNDNKEGRAVALCIKTKTQNQHNLTHFGRPLLSRREEQL